MSDDAHAQANARQVQMLREALMNPAPPEHDPQAEEAGGEPSPAPIPDLPPPPTS